MRILVRTALVSAALAALAGLTPTNADAGGTVGVLVLKEHGVGSAAQAQPYLDKFVAMAAKQNGWAGAAGKYTTTRAQADAYIQSDKPHFGLFSLAAFLAYRDAQKLDVIGQVAVANGGGQQYHVLSKNQGDISACKGKTLASDHADDPRFIDKVVFNGQHKLSDFTLVATTRPLQTIKKVAGGEAECALVDDAQYAQLGSLPEAQGVKSVWKSAQLPPMVMVAFPAAPADEKKGFQGNLDKICQGDGAQTCKELGIQSIASAGASTYAAVVTAYNK